MKKYKTLLVVLTALCSLLPALLYSQVDTAWVRRYNGPSGTGGDYASAMAVDGTGNVYVTGRSSNGANYDYATIKYNAAGETLWVRRYNGPGNGADYAYAIKADGTGNVYITGQSSGGAAPGTGNDYATIKYNTAGDTLWVRRYNGPLGTGADVASALAVDSAGNIYVTGNSNSGAAPGTGYDYATIKYNADGETLWVRRYIGSPGGGDYASAIAVDGTGNVYVTGYSTDPGATVFSYATIKYNSNGDTLWVRRYKGPGSNSDTPRAIAVDGAGNVYVTGQSSGPGTPGQEYDYATIKYNAAGDTLWVRRYNGPGNSTDWAWAIAVDGAGNAYVTGQSAGIGSALFDYATIKYNAAGDTLWVRSYNGPGDNFDVAYAIAVDGTGNVYITGYSTGSGTGYDYATIKYNSAGVQQWVSSYNGPGNGDDQANAIALDGAGNIYVTGYSPGSGTGNDYATIKYVQSGAIEESFENGKLQIENLSVYPNPAKTYFNIRLPQTADRIKIFDVTGKIVKSEELRGKTNRVSLDGIKNGIYFVRVGNEMEKEKLIVSR